MKFVFLLLAVVLVACSGVSNLKKVSDSKEFPPRVEFEALFEVKGDASEGISPKDFQVVAYQTTPVKKTVPYSLILKPHFEWENGNLVYEGYFSYELFVDENNPPDEIVWFNKGVAYQTLSLEYMVDRGEIVSVRAFWNGELELCKSSRYIFGTDSYLLFFHMPDSRTSEDNRFTVFKNDPKSRETEQYKTSY
jgi:hypothetical protein